MKSAAKSGGSPGMSNGKAIYALALLTTISAFNYFDRSILGLLLPLIKKDMALSDTVLGLVTGLAFAMFNVILTVPIAQLADRWNRRNVIAIGLAFWSAMTLLTGFAVNVWQLALARFLMGAGEAAGVAPSNSLVGDLFPRSRRGLTISILTSGNSLGIILFIPIAAWVAQLYGWRAAFVVAGAPGIALALLLWLTVPEPRREGPGPEAAGAAGSLMATLRFLAGSGAFVLLVLGGVLLNSATAVVSTWWASFLTRVHQMPMTEVGLIMGPVRGGLSLVAVILGGYLSDRLGRRDPRWLMWAPGLASLLAAPAMVLFLFGGSTSAVVVGAGAASFFMAMTQGAAFAACSQLAKPHMRATAVAVFLFTGYLVGFAGAPLLVGYLNDIFAAELGAAAIRYTLLVGAACCLGGGVLYLLSGLSMDRGIRRAGGAD